MTNIECHLNPLFRPPLSLAVAAAATKCVVTACVLGEPLLLTRGDYLKKREERGGLADTVRFVLILARVAFLGLAGNTFLQDVREVSEGSANLHMWERCHLLASALAFSPNTVAAVAQLGILEVKAYWVQGLPLHPSFLGRTCDILATVYWFFMGLVYLLPITFVAVVYGLPGLCVIVYAFARDAVLTPLNLFSKGFAAFDHAWIAFPIFVAFVVGNLFALAILIGYIFVLQRRYPQIAQEVRGRRGCDGSGSKFALPLSGNVIGCVRELTGLQQKKGVREVVCRDSGWDGDEDLLPASTDEALASAPSTDQGSTVRVAKSLEERCVLNDTRLGSVLCTKVMMCVAMPALQLCVIVAVKSFLGGGTWEAALEVFGERTWSHYLQRVRQSGTAGLATIVWYYA